MPRKPKARSLETLTREIYAANLSLAELQELQAIVDTLVELKTIDPESQRDSDRNASQNAPQNAGAGNARTKPKRSNWQNYRGERGGRGYVEEKFINGCGPYSYLRYWRGKHLKSLYLGKSVARADAESDDKDDRDRQGNLL